ncbi:MAG: hypothetical protein Q8L88_12800 [Bacteroidota bacterium]|nr:hypothetical protein [Bacteroidota bacterium]
MKKFSYSVILQQKGDQPKTEGDTFETYRSFVDNGIQTALTELDKVRSDTIQKNGTILRGGLGHFLSTPLKSDTDEIIRLIRDNIENTVQQLDAAAILSSVEHTLWKIIEPQNVPLHRQLVGVVKRLLKNGRTILADAGCQFGKNSGETIFSKFSFNGFATAQSLKTIIDQFRSQQTLEVINGTLSSTITAIEEGESIEKFIVQIDFDAPNDLVISQLLERIPVMLDQFGIKNFIVSKQSLHGGVGGEYQIQFKMNIDKYPLGTVIMSLVGDSEELEEAITVHGSLIVLEQI